MDETTLHLWELLGTMVGTLIWLAFMFWVGKQTLLQARGLWATLRGYRHQVVARVDETDDPVIVRLAQLTHASPGVWATFLPAVLHAVADGLDQLLDASSESMQAANPIEEGDAETGSER